MQWILKKNSTSTAMEIAGLGIGAVGLVGLYNACVEVVDRIHSYRRSEIESRHLFAQFDANRIIFRDWAQRVGISQTGLNSPHDKRLDNLEIARAVCGVLSVIQDVLARTDLTGYRDIDCNGDLEPSSPTGLTTQTLLSTSALSSRKRSRLAWSLQGKSKFTWQVEKFTNCLNQLEKLLPIGHDVTNQDLLEYIGSLNIQGDPFLHEHSGISKYDM